MPPAVRAVLLDSGGVLVGPVGGRWNPRVDFEATVLRHAPQVTASDLRAAIAAGDEHLAAAAPDASRDDYHRAMLGAIGVPASAALLADLRRPLDPVQVVEPYPEVTAALAELQHRGIRLAVASDNDSTLRALHEGIGMARFFGAYAISAELGCTKPDPRLWAHAADRLAVDPAQCLVVDDVPTLVAAAIDLGYQGCAVIRSGERPGEVPAVTDLWGVVALATGRPPSSG